VDPYHLIFMIWGATQHYSDFMPQIRAVTGTRFKKADFEAARNSICSIILRGVLLT
jgi:TetR/AcrR family transcriptional regulator